MALLAWYSATAIKEKRIIFHHFLTYIKDSIGDRIGMIRNNKFRNTNKSKLKSIKVRGNKLNKG